MALMFGACELAGARAEQRREASEKARPCRVCRQLLGRLWKLVCRQERPHGRPRWRRLGWHPPLASEPASNTQLRLDLQRARRESQLGGRAREELKVLPVAPVDAYRQVQVHDQAAKGQRAQRKRLVEPLGNIKSESRDSDPIGFKATRALR